MLSRSLKCITVCVLVSAFKCLCLLYFYIFFLYKCVHMSSEWCHVLFCAAFSIPAPSVSRNTFRHSIHQINSEGAEITGNACLGFCLCKCCQLLWGVLACAHNCILIRISRMICAPFDVYIYTTCNYVCRHRYNPSKDIQHKETTMRVMNYEHPFVLRRHPPKAKTWLLSEKQSSIGIEN